MDLPDRTKATKAAKDLSPTYPHNSIDLPDRTRLLPTEQLTTDKNVRQRTLLRGRTIEESAACRTVGMGSAYLCEETGLYAAEELWIKIYYTLTSKILDRHAYYVPPLTTHILTYFNIFFDSYEHPLTSSENQDSFWRWDNSPSPPRCTETTYKDFVAVVDLICPALKAKVDAQREARSNNGASQNRNIFPSEHYRLVVTLEILHGVFDNPDSLPDLPIPPSFRTEEEEWLARYKAFQEDIPGYADLSDVEKEIRDLTLPYHVPPLGFSGEIQDLIKRREALKREMVKRERDGRVYGEPNM